MTDHPEFPQESPAMKYIVDQVAKIESAQACSAGYYKSLSKVLNRLDKTDVAINQTNQALKDIKSLVDSKLFEEILNRRLDEMQNTINTAMSALVNGVTKSTGEHLSVMEAENRKMIEKLSASNATSMDRVNYATQDLNKLIQEVSDIVKPSWWNTWGKKAVIFFLLGVLFGMITTAKIHVGG